MAEQKSSLVVAVFEYPAQARQAFEELSNAGFGKDYLGIADPDAERSRMQDHLKNTGVPEADALFYQQEYEAGHALVTVRVGGLQPASIQKAVDILRRQGAYDANTGRSRDQQKLGANADRSADIPFFDITS